MTNIIFARPRRDYLPYHDLYKLITLSGFPLLYLDQIDWTSNDVVIATPVTSEWNDIPMNKHVKLIHWNFERCREDMPFGDMSHPVSPPQVNETWASDKAMAQDYGFKYTFLGGHRAFGSVDVQNKRYDIVTLMYYSGRRQRLTSELQGYRLADTHEGLWGNERHERLMQTRLMLSAHQDDKPYSEPIRFMIAGCYALPLLSETCEDSGYWKAGKHYSAQPLDSLTDHAAYLLDDPVCLARYGAAAWRLCCVERPFAQEVKGAL